jgi:hypothetical protein
MLGRKGFRALVHTVGASQITLARLSLAVCQLACWLDDVENVLYLFLTLSVAPGIIRAPRKAGGHPRRRSLKWRRHARTISKFLC